MYETFCGIDFGTTNSAVSVMAKNKSPELIKFEYNKETIPTAMFFPESQAYAPIYGTQAIEEYIGGKSGRFMRSLKRLLGTDLMNIKTEVNAIRMSYEDIIMKFVKYLKQTSESQIGKPLESIVFGRPVHFQDFSPQADDSAENMLRRIAVNVGFKNINFQYEPLAAAYAHEAMLNQEKLACVVDIGGGTSDFSIVRLGSCRKNKADRQNDVLANSGIRVGGNDFDRALSIKCFMPQLGYGTLLNPDSYTKKVLPVPTIPYIMLSEWSSINSLYTYKEQKNIEQIYEHAAEPQKVGRIREIVIQEQGHALLNKVEEAKIALAGQSSVNATLDCLKERLNVEFKAEDFYNSINNDSDKIINALNECLCQAEIENSKIELVILTGGSTEIPYIKQKIASLFPQAAVSSGNKMSSVALGLAYAAANIYK